MVDAVSSVNIAAKTELQRKKNEDIAWERLTPEQVLGYVTQGEDVPEAILKWAEEVNKLENIPDDVTYSSVNGSSNRDEIEQTLAQEDDDEPDADDAAEKVTTSQAQQFRQSMEMSGESKYEQGKSMANQSLTSSKSEKAMESKLEQNGEQSEKISSSAEENANKTESKTASLKQELDRLLEKAQSKDKNLSPADLNRIAALGTMLNSIGTQSQQEIAQIGMQLNELDAEIEQFKTIPSTATDFGTETVDIGTELMSDDETEQQQINDAAKTANGINTAKVALNASRLKVFSLLLNRNSRMGVYDVKTGGDAMDAGTSGNSTLSTAQSSIESQYTRIEAAQSKVEDSTGIGAVEIPRIDETQQEEQQQNTDAENTDGEKEKSEEVKTSSDKTDEKDVKDSTLVIDSDELKKRREEQGLE